MFPFLKLSIKYINFRKRTSELFILIISIIILITPFLFHYIYLQLNQSKLDTLKKYKNDNNFNYDDYLDLLHLKNYISNTVVNAVFTIDIEFFVLCIQLLIIIFQIKGRYNILSFFTDIRWGVFSKCYFSFSVLCNMIILFTIYSAESLISLNIYTIYLYFIFNAILIVIFMFCVYIFYELPLKKLIKNIFYKSQDNNDDIDDDDDNNDNDNNKKKQDDNDKEGKIGNKNDENKLMDEDGHE